MDREIKFRAKTINTGNWVKSITISKGTIKLKSRDYFFELDENRWVGVDDKTIGQYTGLKDKNGKECYDGDIIKAIDCGIMSVRWSEKYASFALNKKGWGFNHFFGDVVDPNNFEIIGNIYEHPNLLIK